MQLPYSEEFNEVNKALNNREDNVEEYQKIEEMEYLYIFVIMKLITEKEAMG